MKRSQKLGGKSVPIVSVSWLVTSKCNYNCDFCYKKTSIKDIDLSEAEKILDKLVKAGVKKISFSGGEPLVWNGIDRLMKRAHDKGVVTMLLTNGALLTKKTPRLFNGSLDWLCLPLDGASEESQVLMDRMPGHFDHVIELLEKWENQSVKLKLNTVLSRRNLAEIEKIADLVKKYGVKRWKIFQFFPVRDAALDHKEEYEIDDEDFSQIEKKILPMFKDNGCMVSFNSCKRLERSYFTIAPDGTVYLTEKGKDITIGDLKKQSVEEIWSNELIDKDKYWQRTKWVLE